MKQLLALMLALLCSSAFAEEARPEVSRYTRAYTGEEGIQVFVTRIGPAEKGEVLIQFSHIDHPLENVIQKAKVENTERGRRYILQKNGEDYVPLILEGSSGTAYLPYLPNNLRSWHVQYDEGWSSRANSAGMLTQWLETGKK